MTKSKIELDRLLQVSMKVLTDEKFDGDLQEIEYSSKKDNIWKKICSEYFNGSWKKKDLLNIYSWWNRDTKKFKSLLTSRFTKNHNISEEIGNLFFKILI